MFLHASTVAEWRDWLARNGETETEVWLVIQHADSPTPGPRYEEAVAHGLCFGWIDSQNRKYDEHSSAQRFTPRKPRSSWSASNRERVATMIEQGLMTARGQALVDVAKAKGLWEINTSQVSADLAAALSQNATAKAYFEELSTSALREILEWIASAKRPETRRRRIERAVARASG
jgi:uncharacterized protein YdeI (YjbR/CyaY-like superfamily)